MKHIFAGFRPYKNKTSSKILNARWFKKWRLELCVECLITEQQKVAKINPIRVSNLWLRLTNLYQSTENRNRTRSCTFSSLSRTLTEREPSLVRDAKRGSDQLTGLLRFDVSFLVSLQTESHAGVINWSGMLECLCGRPESFGCLRMCGPLMTFWVVLHERAPKVSPGSEFRMGTSHHRLKSADSSGGVVMNERRRRDSRVRRKTYKHLFALLWFSWRKFASWLGWYKRCVGA